MPSNDAHVVYELLISVGPEGIGNVAARQKLAWRQRGRFERARDTLIAAGVVRVLPGGRGGRLAIIDGAALPHIDSLDVATERGLYTRLVAPLVDILCAGDDGPEDDLDASYVAVDVTGDLGGLDTGGRLSRPDLVGAVRRPLTGFDALEIHGFEVKAYWAADRIGIYEAVAQRALGLCTHAWVVLYVPTEDVVSLSPRDRGLVRDVRDRLAPDGPVRKEAADLGLGLIVIDHLGSGGQRRVNYPARYGAEPTRLDRFLAHACPGLLTRIDVFPRAAVL